MTGVHGHQPPPLARQQLRHGRRGLRAVQQAQDVRRRKAAERPREDGGPGERRAGVRRRTGEEPRDLLVVEVLARELGGGRGRPEAVSRLDGGGQRLGTLPPLGHERLAVRGDDGVHEHDPGEPVPDALGRLADRDARVAVPDEPHVPQVVPLHRLDDVPHVRHLVRGLAASLREAGQRHRPRAVPGPPELGRHLVPGPASEPRSRHQHEFAHEG
ncbi:hypothetical protein IAG43_28670 [Streptomyces genisteinicus]|uniref:Uncharacterized protein n=1 Tax=Streptomyces genisteinicus TaxID=2768068 RepID=A0A7H0I144_9ACTN|nr:hypothetical protein IAG43_28670 [Streptomyces genisteinicus]